MGTNNARTFYRKDSLWVGQWCLGEARGNGVKVGGSGITWESGGDLWHGNLCKGSVCRDRSMPGLLTVPSCS